LPSSIQFERAEDHSPESLAVLVAQKLGIKPFQGKASQLPPPQMTSLSGEPVFDYSAYNGRYIIGNGPLTFETEWSKASDDSIHTYNDPSTINGIAIARDCRAIKDVVDATKYDFSSRSRTPKNGDILILRNTDGFYAAVQILDIKDETRGDDRDELRFSYIIQSDGSSSFAAFDEEDGDRRIY
jgi:hypothetical protein